MRVNKTEAAAGWAAVWDTPVGVIREAVAIQEVGILAAAIPAGVTRGEAILVVVIPAEGIRLAEAIRMVAANIPTTLILAEAVCAR